MILNNGLNLTLAKHASAVHLRYPSDTSTLVYEARAHRWMRDIKSAQRTYSLVLQRYPGHIEALQFLAENK